MLAQAKLGRPLRIGHHLRIQSILDKLGGLVPYSDAFAGADGASLAAAWTAPTWDIQGNEARNQPTAGAELVVNGDFAAWTADDPDDWILANVDANNHVTENPAGQCQFICDNSQALLMRQSVAGITGAWYLYGLLCTAAASGGVRFQMPSGQNAGAFISGVDTYLATVRQLGSDWRIIRGGACDITLDDMSLKALTLASLFGTVKGGAPDASVQAGATLTTFTQAGVVACLDDATTPTSFLIAYHDGSYLYLDKCVSGTYTNLTKSAGAVYAAGAPVKVVKSGTSVELYYNGVQRDTQTVTEPEIIHNTLHGIFSTHADNRLDDFVLEAP